MHNSTLTIGGGGVLFNSHWTPICCMCLQINLHLIHPIHGLAALLLPARPGPLDPGV